MLVVVRASPGIVEEVFEVSVRSGCFGGQRRAVCAGQAELAKGLGVVAESSLRLVRGEGKPAISF